MAAACLVYELPFVGKLCARRGALCIGLYEKRPAAAAASKLYCVINGRWMEVIVVCSTVVEII